MARFTIHKAKKVEQAVCDALNESNSGFKYTLCPYTYESYDIFGVGLPGSHHLVEVKERDANYWSSWFIEEKKLLSMVAHKKEMQKRGNSADLSLAIVCKGETRMYSVRDIMKYPVKEVAMNATTAKGFRGEGKKINKRVYDFPKSLKHRLL